MPEEPVEVEVLDRDGTPVLERRSSPERVGLSPFNPLYWMLYACALVFAMGMLMMAVGQLMQQRARELGDDQE